MSKTFNRRPQLVTSPSSNDVKDYYFNHFNWRGMSTDKNFLAADQETFEYCSNVYCDEEGLLRSRPAIKRATGLVDCEKFWAFGDIIVYKIRENDTPKLLFPGDKKLSLISEDVNLVRKDNRIFIFSDAVSLSYYDLNTAALVSSNSSVYLPAAEIFTGNEWEKGEAKSFLSNAIRRQFTFYRGSSLPAGVINGADVKIDGKQYSWNAELMPEIFFTAKNSLPFLSADSNVRIAVSNALGHDMIAVINESDGRIYCNASGAWLELGQISVNESSLIKEFDFAQDGSLIYVVYDSDSDGNWYGGQVAVVDTLPTYNKYPVLKKLTLFGAQVMAADFITNTHYAFLYYRYYLVIYLDGDSFLYPYEDYYYHYKYIIPQVFDFRLVYSSDISAKAKAEFIAYRKIESWGELEEDADVAEQGYYHFSTYENALALHETRIWAPSSSTQLTSNDNVTFALIFPMTTGSARYLMRINNNWYSYAGQISQHLSEQFAIDVDGVSAIRTIGDQVLIGTTLLAIRTDGYDSRQIACDVSDFDTPSSGNNIYFVKGNTLYSNEIEGAKIAEFVQYSTDASSLVNETFVIALRAAKFAELDTFYVASGNTLYISEDRYDDNGNFQWYFPEYTRQVFAKPITKLIPISATEVAIFFADEVWYSSYKDSVYSYYKSKLPIGLSEMSDVVTSYDGANTIFATERGLSALSYQDFVASSEQTLTFLSDPIHRLFNEFATSPVKICRYQYWYICYNPDNQKAYMLDTRNGSWWPLEGPNGFDEIFVFNNRLCLFKAPKFYILDTSDDAYYDEVQSISEIDWNVKSQKLHLNAINFTKHIANFTLYSVLDTDKRVCFQMDVINYRKKMDHAQIQTIEYKVDAIRTFVKRVSYFAVNEFQYNLHQDDEQAIKVPLSLSGITIKYRICGEVR